MSNQALIIDDNVDNVGILEELLTMEGIEYTSIHDPARLGSVDSGDYKIVFLDLEMPNLNGYEVLNKLKSNANFNGVPIIAYSVHVSEVAEIRQRGFDGFVGKPLNADTFSDSLQKIFAGEKVWVIP